MLRFFTIAAVLVAVALPVRARAAKKDEDKQFIVRPQVYAYLEKAHKAYDKSDWVTAIEQIERLEKRERLNDHEKALARQTLGFVYAGQENMKKAAVALEECVTLDALPSATQISVLYTLGQVYFAAKQYAKSVNAYERWIAVAQNPSADALYTIAAAKYYAKQYRGAAEYAGFAIKRTKNPKTAWLQLRLAALLEDKRYREAIPLQKQLTERMPDNRGSWQQLVSLFAETGDVGRALAVNEIGYHAGVFVKPEDIKDLAQRMMSMNVPAKAAAILEKELASKRLPTTPETTKLLADAWYQASDMKRAAAAAKEAAKRAPNGKLYVRLAQIELEREQFDAAIDAGKKAIEKGGIGSEGQVLILIGIAQHRKGRIEKARNAFQKAARVAKQEGTRKAANNWLKFLKAAGQSAGSG